MTTTTIRATALPLPAVKITGREFVTGASRHKLVAREVIVGDRRYGLTDDGMVWDECPRCSGRGMMREYAEIYNGECFQCRYKGAVPAATSVQAIQRKVRSTQAAEMRRAAKWEAERPAREAAAAEAFARDYDMAVRENERREARAAEVATMRYAGDIGETITVHGVVKVSMEVEGFRPGSYSRLVIIEGTGSDEGITLKTVGTSSAHREMARDSEVTVTATVKAHSTYRDVPQTVVVRPKLS